MATFPTSLPSYTNPTSTDYLSSPAHATQHSGANDEIVAIATKVGINNSTDVNSLDFKTAYFKSLPEGTMINGKIVPSVSSNSLTLALKGMDGNNISATNPLYVRIGDTIRTITSAPTFTVDVAANYLNLGSTELTGKEVDLFVYLIWSASDNDVRMLTSRIPYANVYSDFVASGTSEKGYNCSEAYTATATDQCSVIGRFACTLTAVAGPAYNWSVPTFTGTNLIQRPIYETRWLEWKRVYTSNGGMAGTEPGTWSQRYKVRNDSLILSGTSRITTSGTTANTLGVSLPFTLITPGGTEDHINMSFIANGSGVYVSVRATTGGPSNVISITKMDVTNFSLSEYTDISINETLRLV